MYKNILFMGGAGYICIHLVLGLKKANFNPFVLDTYQEFTKKYLHLL